MAAEDVDLSLTIQPLLVLGMGSDAPTVDWVSFVPCP